MANKDPDLNAELEALKEQVRVLSEAQGQAVQPTAPREAEPEAPEGETDSKSPLSMEFDDLVELLKGEIEGLPPLTCIAIFGLGVLTGRLLAN